MNADADAWLVANGLEKYCDAFRENDVDMRALPYLTEDDLRELGLSLGHRRIFLAALKSVGGPTDEGSGEIEALRSETPLAGAIAGSGSDAEHRHLSVMFVDMAGSTQLAEALDPEDLRDLLQRYQDTVASVVARFGGHVAKYMGDGVLAYFGWPAAYEDHAERAVRAGLGVVDAVRALSQSGQNAKSPRYHVRVGVASGAVVVGDLVGTQMREDDAMVGAVVNLAARLQGEAQNDSVAVAQETCNLIGQGFELEDLGPRSLKGFESVRNVYLVTGERALDSRFQATRSGRDSPLVGRDEEMAILARTWDAACSKHGQVVLLSGEAGIGKSRIAQAFVDSREEGAQELLRYQCAPYHANSAFHPIIERMSRAAGLSPDNPVEENRERVVELVKSQFLDPKRDAASYATLLGVKLPKDQDLSSVEPQELKHRIIETMTRSVAERAARHPILMILEDAHWIDPSSLETFERIVETCGDLPVMLVVTHRPEWSCDWPSVHPHVSVLRLGRLSRDNVDEMIRGILDRELEEDLVEDLVQRTDGVPLFVEELARTLGENTDGRLEDAVPDSLQGVLLARLERVSRKARSVSLVASVIGRDFDRDLLGSVADLAPDEIGPALEELRRANIIYESGQSGSFAFRHALIQDAAYQALLRRNRRALHGKLARALEVMRRDQIEREPELVAWHYTEAGEMSEALKNWTAAAQRALERSANYEAVSHASQVLAIAENLSPGNTPSEAKTRARILLSEACAQAGDLPRALENGLQAANEARLLGDPILFSQVAISYADNVLMAGRNPEVAIEICEEALADKGLDDVRLRCRLYSELARGHMMNGNLAASTVCGREAEVTARSLGDSRALFRLMMARFLVPAVARDAEEVANWRERIRTLLDLADRTDDMDRGRASAVAVGVATEMGDRDMMEEALRRLDDVGAARQHMHMDWVGRNARAMNAILDGDFVSAEQFATEARRLGQNTHGSHVEGLYGVQMFSIRREQGRLAEVAPTFKLLLDSEDEGTSWRPGFALIAAELGHLDAARRMMQEMAANSFDLPLDAKYSSTLGYLADTAVMIGDHDMAETLYDRLLPYRGLTVTMGVATVCYGAADRRLGALAALRGDWSLMAEHFEAALELDSNMRSVPWLARTKSSYAHAMLRRGRSRDTERANRLLSEAMATSRKFGMVALEATLRTVLH